MLGKGPTEFAFSICANDLSQAHVYLYTLNKDQLKYILGKCLIIDALPQAISVDSYAQTTVAVDERATSAHEAANIRAALEDGNRELRENTEELRQEIWGRVQNWLDGDITMSTEN